MNFSWMSASKEGNRIGDEEEEVIRSNIHLKAPTHTHTHAHAHHGSVLGYFECWMIQPEFKFVGTGFPGE